MPIFGKILPKKNFLEFLDQESIDFLALCSNIKKGETLLWQDAYLK